MGKKSWKNQNVLVPPSTILLGGHLTINNARNNMKICISVTKYMGWCPVFSSKKQASFLNSCHSDRKKLQIGFIDSIKLVPYIYLHSY